MDVCLIRIEATPISFAKPKRPIYIVLGNHLLKITGDKFSVGGREREKERTFHHQTQPYSAPAMIDLTTDGYASQVNQEMLIFGSRYLETLLTEIAPKPAADQLKILEEKLTNNQLGEDQREE